jgi:hypothetical protein
MERGFLRGLVHLGSVPVGGRHHRIGYRHRTLLEQGGYEMTVAIIALIFYWLDKELGIIMAIVSPTVLAMDTDGSYKEMFVLVFIGLGFYFVRKIGMEELHE